jgi:hypothetical protein
LYNSFPENQAVYEMVWKTVINSNWPKATVQYSACALHAVYLRLQTHPQNM